MDGCDWLLCGGVDALEGLAVNAFHEFVIDEAIVRLVVSISSMAGSGRCSAGLK